MKTVKCFLLVIMIVSLRSYSQDDKIASMMKGVPTFLTGCLNEHFFYSKEVNSTFVIKVYLPATYLESQIEYPVMVLTDAFWTMGIAQTTFDYMSLSKEIPEVILIGVSYPYSSSFEMIKNRFRDMTPTHVEGYNPSGLFENFIAFLKNELLPSIEDNYRVDTTNICYFGHSLGGLFGSHLLLEHPDIFNHYIIGSPSYWWDNKEIFKLVSTKSTLDLANVKSIYTFIGGNETKLMIENFKEFNILLEPKLKNVRFLDQIFADESHSSVTPAAFLAAVKFVYKKI